MLQRPTTDSFRAMTSGNVAVAAVDVPVPAGPTAAPASARRPRRSIRSLLTPEQLNGAIHRESARVDRKSNGEGTLVLVLFRFTGARNVPSTIRLAKSILQRIRITDDIGWFDAHHIGVLLPDTAPAGAWRLAQYVCDRLARRGGSRPHVTMYSYGGDAAREEPGAAPSVMRQTDEPALPRAKAG